MSDDDGLIDSESEEEEEEEEDDEVEEPEDDNGQPSDDEYSDSDGNRGRKGKGFAGSNKKRARGESSSRKKRARTDMSRFVDDMAAEVDEDDEEDYDEQDRAKANELSSMERDMHERIKRRQQQSAEFMNQSLEEQAAQIMRRHGARLPRSERSEVRVDSGIGADSGVGLSAGVADYSDEEDINDDQHGMVDPEVAQQALLPGIADKSLFVVECKTGKEATLCHALMNKAVYFKTHGKELGLTSVVVPAGSKGFLYLEATNEPAVREAINGLRGIYHSKLRKVPIPDMTAVLSVRNENRSKPVSHGQFVRLKRKPYKDDLAKVEEVLIGGERAVVQFIPRIDLASLSADADILAARKNIRPPQRFFNPEEIKQASDEAYIERRRFQGNGDHMDFFQNNFYRNGFVIKEVNVNTWLRTDKVNPTLEELQRFKSRKEKKDPSALDDSEDEQEREEEDKETEVMEELAMAQAMEPKTDTPLFAKGDTVVVVKGDLTELMGKVLGVRQTGQSAAEGIVRIQPLIEELANEVVELKPDQLEKYLKVGSHVRIIDGRFTGETGTILKVVKDKAGASRAMVLTDMSSKELEVHVSQLQETPEVSTGLDSLQGYELYDLVMLGPNEVGVVTRVNREDLEVVNNSGNLKRVRPQEIRGKRNTQSRRAFVVDAQQNQLEVDNVVTVVEGQHARSTGTIKHIDRTTLFLHSRTHTQNGGIFPVRARSALLAGRQNKGQAAVGYMGEINATAKNDIVKDFRNRNDEMLSKTVKIVRGQHKGLMGQVVEATDTHVKVELHSKLKKVTIARNQVKAIGDQSGAYAGNAFRKPVQGEVPGTPFLTMQTPTHGAQTPMHGSQTPMHGSQTPIHGSQTPIHGSQTPLHGSQTPVHGSQTPLHSGNQTPIGAGGQTPLHGSQTPVYSKGSDTSGDSWRYGSSRNGWDSPSGPRDRNGGNNSYGTSLAPSSEGAGGYTPSDGYGGRAGGSAYGDRSGGSYPSSVQNSPYRSDSLIRDTSAVISAGAWRDLPPPISGWTRDGVCIIVIATGRKGHIVSSRQDGPNVELTVEVDGLGRRALTPEEVRPMPPQTRDTVIVVGSRDDGRKGILKKIDGRDGIVKYAGGSERDVIPLQNILRLK